MRRETAHWIQYTHLFREDEYECSVCGAKSDKLYRTCPHCGIQMKGSKNDLSWVDEIVLIDTVLDN